MDWFWTAILTALGLAVIAVICYRTGVMDGKEAMLDMLEKMASESMKEGFTNE